MTHGTMAIVCAYPDFVVDPELIHWLRQILPPERITLHVCGHLDYSVAQNMSIRIALESACHRFIFADKDIVPVDAEPFLRDEADMVGIWYDNGQKPSPSGVHSALWRTTRTVLESIAPPWYRWKYSADGSEREVCGCAWLEARVRAKGFSVAVAGTARHVPFTLSRHVATLAQLGG